MKTVLFALAIVYAAPQPETVHQTDDEFVRFAVAANLAEVELSAVAVDHASSGAVKQFAQQMTGDHHKAGLQIKAIADRKHIPIPTALDGEHASLKKQLLSLKGADFDRRFMDAMVDDHKATVAAFTNEAEHGADADIKAYAMKTLPTIERHRKLAEQIDNTLGTRP